MKHIVYIDTPLGNMSLTADETGICGLDLHGSEAADIPVKETAVLKTAKIQLEEYFLGKRKEFDVPLSLEGTKFQVSVWNALCTIPYGELRSYKQIAELVNCPKGFRAVGMANHVNPVSIIVPCHRVVGSDGSMTGYGGGLDMKKYLLELERKWL